MRCRRCNFQENILCRTHFFLLFALVGVYTTYIYILICYVWLFVGWLIVSVVVLYKPRYVWVVVVNTQQHTAHRQYSALWWERPATEDDNAHTPVTQHIEYTCYYTPQHSCYTPRTAQHTAHSTQQLCGRGMMADTYPGRQVHPCQSSSGRQRVRQRVRHQIERDIQTDIDTRDTKQGSPSEQTSKRIIQSCYANVASKMRQHNISSTSTSSNSSGWWQY